MRVVDIIVNRHSVKQRLRGALAGQTLPPVFRRDSDGGDLRDEYGRLVAAHHLGLTMLAVDRDAPDRHGVAAWLEHRRTLARADLEAMGLHPPEGVTWVPYLPLAVGFVLGAQQLALSGQRAAGRFDAAQATGAPTGFVDDPMPRGLWPALLGGLEAVGAGTGAGKALLADCAAVVEKFRMADAQMHATDTD